MIATTTPEQVGMSSARLADLHAAMQAFVNEGKFAGVATIILRRGQVVDSSCYGKLDIAAGKPLLPDSLFRMASLTKPVTAVAALMLCEEGRFNLDDPVSRWIPAFADSKVGPASTGGEPAALETPITFRHLLTHTAGLGLGLFDGPVEDAYRGAQLWSPIFTLLRPLPDTVGAIATLPLYAQPGTEFHYSMAFDVLGYLIGVISGQPFDVFLRERIFKPLGMPDTGFFVPANELERLGPMYKPRCDEDRLVVVDELAGSHYANPNAVLSGGGGLVSSMPDFLRFMTMLANGGELDGARLISPASFAAMTTNQLPASIDMGGAGYGLGVGVRLTDDPEQGLTRGAFGWGGGSGTTAWVLPSEEIIVIGMTQSFIDFTAVDTFRRMAHAAILN